MGDSLGSLLCFGVFRFFSWLIIKVVLGSGFRLFLFTSLPNGSFRPPFLSFFFLPFSLFLSGTAGKRARNLALLFVCQFFLNFIRREIINQTLFF